MCATTTVFEGIVSVRANKAFAIVTALTRLRTKERKMTETFENMYRPYLDVEFMRDATNVYRTKSFIVKQTMRMAYSFDSIDGIISVDTYYARTPQRDALYEKIFFAKGQRINGKRMIATMYTRTYVL